MKTEGHPLHLAEVDALNKALNNRKDFDNYATPDDYINILNACCTLGLDGEDFANQFETEFKVAYLEWCGKRPSTNFERNYLKEKVEERKAPTPFEALAALNPNINNSINEHYNKHVCEIGGCY